MTSSGSSCASDSTISTPSAVPATTSSSCERFDLVGGRVEDVLAVLVADAGGGDRAEERNAGQRQRGRAADHGDDVGVVLQVVAQHGGDDLDLIAEALGEQRADRPVDQAGLQHLGLGRPALALEEAAGDLAGGERLLLVVHGQREEVLAGSGALHPDGGAQHDRIAVAGQHGAVGLAGDLAGLQDQLAAAPVEFLAEVVEHSYVLTDARHRRTASRTRRWPNWAGGGVSGRMEGAGCVCAERGRSRGPCGRKRRRGSRTSGRRIGGLSVRRVTRRSEAAAGPPRHCPVPPWFGGRHLRTHVGAYYIWRTHYKVFASGRRLERAIEQHPDAKIVRDGLESMRHMRRTEQYVARAHIEVTLSSTR